MISHSILFYVLILFNFGVTLAADFPTFGTASACSLATDLALTPGYSVKYYSYRYNNEVDFSLTGFLASGYTNQQLISSTGGVFSPQFSYGGNRERGTAYSSLYGMNMQITNFVLEYTGYFRGKFYIFHFY